MPTDDVLTVTLSGPGKNSLTTELMTRTLSAVREAGGRPILLTGEGDTFCAGLNLKEVVSLDLAGLTKFLGVLEDLVQALYEYPGPVVGWVNGHAIAGGCVMALTCDLRVVTAREGVRIGLNETALGLRFPPRTFLMCQRRVPGPALERVVLEADLYDARTAKDLGLVDFIGDEADARARLAKLATYARGVYADTKARTRGRLDLAPEVQKHFIDEVLPTWAAPELKEKLAARLKK